MVILQKTTLKECSYFNSVIFEYRKILFRSFSFIVIKHFKIIWLSNLDSTWWRLFQKRVVRTKFDIYVFIYTINIYYCSCTRHIRNRRDLQNFWVLFCKFILKKHLKSLYYLQKNNNFTLFKFSHKFPPTSVKPIGTDDLSWF